MAGTTKVMRRVSKGLPKLGGKLPKGSQKPTPRKKKKGIVSSALSGASSVLSGVSSGLTYAKENPVKAVTGLALMPLTPLAYGASHGFRDPVGAAKVIGTAAIGGPSAGWKANLKFHQGSIGNDLKNAVEYAAKK